MKTSSPLKVTDAIRVIKDNHCEKCGNQAKGFVSHSLTLGCDRERRFQSSTSSQARMGESAIR